MNWIDDVAENVFQNYRNRKIVIWGYSSASKGIAAVLRKSYNLTTEFFIEEKADNIAGRAVRALNEVDDKSNEYYIVIPMDCNNDKKADKLRGGGYTPVRDYYCFCDCTVKKDDEYFEDAHGNRIYGFYKGLKFYFLGWNAIIKIDNKAYIEDTLIYMHNNSVINIGAEAEVIDCHFSLGDEAKIEMGEKVSVRKANFTVEGNSIADLGTGCHFATGIKLILRRNSSFRIGSGSTVGMNCFFAMGADTRCEIGKDCMFANDIHLRTNDGHSIFDVESKKNINFRKRKDEGLEVKIGNHVWIGMRSTIMYNTNLGNGSIVGACSFVKCRTPNNVLLFGSPAIIKRKNVAWTRADQAEDICSCGEENIRLSEDVNQKE